MTSRKEMLEELRAEVAADKAAADARKAQKRTYSKQWGKDNKQHILDKQTERRRAFKVRIVEMFGGQCSRCNQRHHPAVYMMHHRDPSTKEYDIGYLIGFGWTDRLLKEIEKCDLLCANCHFLTHAEEDGWLLTDQS